MILELRDLHAGYGHVPVLHGIDLTVERGGVSAILGLNGAGKTTTLLAIAGTLHPSAGEIAYEGEPLGTLPAARRVERGIVLCPEGRRVFPDLSVVDNLRAGAWVHRRERRHAYDEVFELFGRLAERRHQPAGTLSGGEQQMLAIGRALMAHPKLLLVDEASLGLAPMLVDELFTRMREIAGHGVSVLLVEQNVGVLDVADHAFLMESGTVVLSGTRKQLMKGQKLRKAYLGAA